VRYADDLVVLCHRKADAIESIRVLKAVFQKLELTMNTENSRLVNLWTCERDQGFDFLGHHLRRMPVMRKGGKEARILRYFPSRKAMKKMRGSTGTSSKRLMIFCRKKYKKWSLRRSRFHEILRDARLRSATTLRSTYCAR